MALYAAYKGKVVRFVAPLSGITHEHIKCYAPIRSMMRTKSESLSTSVIPTNRERSDNSMKMDTERHTHIYL